MITRTSARFTGGNDCGSGQKKPLCKYACVFQLNLPPHLLLIIPDVLYLTSAPHGDLRPTVGIQAFPEMSILIDGHDISLPCFS